MADEQARWPARPHVSAEQVADLLEGLHPEAEAATVAAHLDGCAECARLRDDLEALPALLAATTAPPMPADVAARLDTALADAAADRERAARPATVTSLHSRLPSRKSSLFTRSFAAAAAAAAVVVGFVVVGDVTGGGDDDASQAGAGADSALRDNGGGAAEEHLDATPLARLTSGDFRSDARAAYLSSPTAEDAPLDHGARTDPELAGPVSCSTADLRGAGIPGRPGPVALLDRVPVRLVASGPPQHSLVVAYSCESGAPVEHDRAYVNLTR